MILDLYIFLMFLSVLFVFLGFFLKGQVDAFKFIGFIFIFILGLMMMPVSPIDVEYETGSTITDNDGSYVVVDNYEPYEDFTIGLYIAILGAIGFVSSFIMRGRNEKQGY